MTNGTIYAARFEKLCFEDLCCWRGGSLRLSASCRLRRRSTSRVARPSSRRLLYPPSQHLKSRPLPATLSGSLSSRPCPARHRLRTVAGPAGTTARALAPLGGPLVRGERASRTPSPAGSSAAGRLLGEVGSGARLAEEQEAMGEMTSGAHLLTEPEGQAAEAGTATTAAVTVMGGATTLQHRR